MRLELADRTDAGTPPPSARALRRRTLLLTAVGILLSAGFLALAGARVHWRDVAAALDWHRIFPWLPCAVLCYLAGHVVRGARCRLILGRARLPTLTATNVVVIGYAANNILPVRLGELVRSWMISDRTGIPLPQSFAVTLLERVLDGLVILFLFFLSARFALPPQAAWVHTSILIGSAAIGGAALLIVAVAWSGASFLRLVSTLFMRFSRLHDPALKLASQLAAAVAPLARPRLAFQILGLSIIVWLLETGLFLFLLPMVGLPMRLTWALFAMSLTNLGIMVPSSPGYIGPFHFFCKQAVVLLGAPGAVGFAYAMLVHVSFYVPITVWGLAALTRYGVELATLVSNARAARHPFPALLPDPIRAPALGCFAPSVRNDKSSPFLTAVARALISPGAPAALCLSAREQAEVFAEVGDFVAGQMGALPMRLRSLFFCGMLLFKVTVVARTGRGFAALSDERQRRMIDGWAFGRVALLRQLFRPPRASALLAFYDHPCVGRAVLSLNGRDAPMQVGPDSRTGRVPAGRSFMDGPVSST